MEQHLITRDWLAIERTRLANERTFLSYFRTAVVFLGTGITVLKVDLFLDIKSFGWWLIGLAFIILVIGIYRLLKVKANIKRYYKV